MDDSSIIDLYWQRSEQAIQETDSKYGGYCFRIAYSILSDREDARESVSDTYLAAWNAMPPQRPAVLAVFLGRITRNLSVSRWRKRSCAKRGGGAVPLALEELFDCADGRQNVEGDLERKELIRCLNAFLATLSQTERDIFLRRYCFWNPLTSMYPTCVTVWSRGSPFSWITWSGMRSPSRRIPGIGPWSLRTGSPSAKTPITPFWRNTPQRS